MPGGAPFSPFPGRSADYQGHRPVKLRSLHVGLCLFAFAMVVSGVCWASDPEVQRWKAATVRPATPITDRHVIHSYFNTSPESPDGKYVLYYTSSTPEGEAGDLRILERSTGKETVMATGISTEDAHRAACQQWANGGKTVVYHDCREGRWCVVAVDLATRKQKVLAWDHQVGFGSSGTPWVPVYGCH